MICHTHPVCLLQQDDPRIVSILEELGHVDPCRPGPHYAHPVLGARSNGKLRLRDKSEFVFVIKKRSRKNGFEGGIKDGRERYTHEEQVLVSGATSLPLDWIGRPLLSGMLPKMGWPGR